MIAKKIEKTNFLIWAGLRLAIPPFLKLNLRANDHTFLVQSALLGWFGGLASLKHYGNKALWQ